MAWPDQDWLLEIVACPMCGGTWEWKQPDDAGHAVARCVACGHPGSRVGRKFYLLPAHLDSFQRSEHIFRQRIVDQWAEDLPSLGRPQLAQVRVLNLLTSYWLSSQYLYFRDCFAKKHTLHGRGLEIGAGTGHESGFIKIFFPDTQMAASDVAPVNIELAEELAQHVGFSTDYFVACDAERLPFLPSTYDFVFSSGVLHHVGDVRSAIRQVHRVLRPGGLWYVVGEISMGRLLRLFWLSRFGEQGRVSREWGIRENNYTYKQWRTFFVEGGFAVKECSFHRDPAHKMLSLSRVLYYRLASRLPDFLFKVGLPSELCFVLEKV